MLLGPLGAILGAGIDLLNELATITGQPALSPKQQPLQIEKFGSFKHQEISITVRNGENIEYSKRDKGKLQLNIINAPFVFSPKACIDIPS